MFSLPTLPAKQGTANPVAALRAKLERLQRVGLTVQNVLDGVACAMERFGVRTPGFACLVVGCVYPC